MSASSVSENSLDITESMFDDEHLKGFKKYFNCCSRLHHVIHLIKRKADYRDEVVVYLTKTLTLMEEVANEPNFLEEEDHVGAECDVMPAQIKDWLSSTFMPPDKYIRKTERPRFRAVAKAVLAMIMVEKIFKKSNENAALKIPQIVAKLMDVSISNWNFDVFSLNKLSDGQGLKNMTLYLFLYHNVLRKYKISVDNLEVFLDILVEGYERNRNPFYNSLHAADVLQTIHFFIQTYKLNVWFTDLQVFTMLFVALIHDYDYSGTSNSYLVQTNNTLALIYNDIHVQENYQVSCIFKLLQKPENNFLRGMSKDDFSEFRRMTIECVLSMDKTGHFHQMKQIRTEIAVSEELDKLKVMTFLLHTADLSNGAKSTNFHIKWMHMMEEQNYKQGDLEYKLNIPYSPLSDRSNVVMIEAINAYLLYIIEPTFNLLIELLEEIEKQNAFIKKIVLNSVDGKDLTKSLSTGQKPRELYPWESLIVLNKSTWQRRFLFKQSSHFE